MKLDIDPVPRVTAGVQTVRCDECAWEAVYIVPEEAQIMVCDILRHISLDHGLRLPDFLCTLH